MMCDDWVLYHDLFMYFDMLYIQWHRLAKKNLWNKVYIIVITADLPTSPESTTETFADDTAVLATDSDPAIASHKLQTDLFAIQT
jgi:hypothetical protein